MTRLRGLAALAAPPRWAMTLSATLGVLAVGFGVALMTSAGYLISRAAEQPPILSLTVVIVGVRFFGLARPLARYLERLASHDAALRTLGRIRARFYRQIEPLAPAELAEYRSGELLGRMVGDVDALQGLYVRGFGPPVVALVVGTASVVVAAVLLPAAALVLGVGLLAAATFVPFVAAAVARSAGRRQVAARAELTADLVEGLRGAPELVAYGREDPTLGRLRTANDELARLSRRDALAGGLADALGVVIVGATVAGVLAVSVAADIDRVLVGTLALLALASFDAVTPLTAAARELSRTLAAGERVVELTDREPTVRDPGEAVPAPARAAPVALRGVTARYPGADEPVFRDLSLSLDPGTKTALVGPSGSGKTTVTNLLLRFLDPEEGRVTIGGRDIREFRQEDVRRMFAVAGQDAHVFNSTIRANLRFARPDAGDAELFGALLEARLDGWVFALPEGLDTLVGEEGDRLSGGQRQRLTLARALLSPAPVLILDEPTAHLDTETAEALVQDIFAAAGERTLLLITHRPEGLDLVDEVVAL